MVATARVATLRADIVGDANQLVAATRQASTGFRNMREANQRAARAARESNSVFANAAKRVAAIGAAFAGGAGLAALARGLGEAVDRGSELVEIGQRLDVTVEALQTLDRIGQSDGVQFTQLTTGLTRFQRALTEAREGVAEYADTFEKLNLDPDVLSGQGLEDQLIAITQGLSQLDTQAERSSALQDLFGRAGAALAPVLDDVGELRESIAALSDLPTLSGVQAAALKDLGQSQLELGQAIRANAEIFYAEIAPFITDLTDLARRVVAGSSEDEADLQRQGEAIREAAFGDLRDIAEFLDLDGVVDIFRPAAEFIGTAISDATASGLQDGVDGFINERGELVVNIPARLDFVDGLEAGLGLGDEATAVLTQRLAEAARHANEFRGAFEQSVTSSAQFGDIEVEIDARASIERTARIMASEFEDAANRGVNAGIASAQFGDIEFEVTGGEDAARLARTVANEFADLGQSANAQFGDIEVEIDARASIERTARIMASEFEDAANRGVNAGIASAQFGDIEFEVTGGEDAARLARTVANEFADLGQSANAQFGDIEVEIDARASIERTARIMASEFEDAANRGVNAGIASAQFGDIEFEVTGGEDAARLARTVANEFADLGQSANAQFGDIEVEIDARASIERTARIMASEFEDAANRGVNAGIASAQFGDIEFEVTGGEDAARLARTVANEFADLGQSANAQFGDIEVEIDARASIERTARIMASEFEDAANRGVNAGLGDIEFEIEPLTVDANITLEDFGGPGQVVDDFQSRVEALAIATQDFSEAYGDIGVGIDADPFLRAQAKSFGELQDAMAAAERRAGDFRQGYGDIGVGIDASPFLRAQAKAYSDLQDEIAAATRRAEASFAAGVTGDVGVGLEQDAANRFAAAEFGAKEQARIEAAAKRANEQLRRQQQIVGSLNGAFSKLAEEAIVDYDNLGDVFDDVVDQLKRMLVQTLLIQPALQGLQGLFGAVAGALTGGGRSGGGGSGGGGSGGDVVSSILGSLGGGIGRAITAALGGEARGEGATFSAAINDLLRDLGLSSDEASDKVADFGNGISDAFQEAEEAIGGANEAYQDASAFTHDFSDSVSDATDRTNAFADASQEAEEAMGGLSGAAQDFYNTLNDLASRGFAPAFDASTLNVDQQRGFLQFVNDRTGSDYRYSPTGEFPPIDIDITLDPISGDLAFDIDDDKYYDDF